MFYKKEGYNILICDDDEISLEINKKYIELFSSKLHITVHLFCYTKCCPEFEQIIQRGTIHIAILDIELDGINGIELAKRILNLNSDTLVIFVTHHSEFASDAFDILAFGFIKKPINQNNFETLFKRAIIYLGNSYSLDRNPFLELIVNKQTMHIRQTMIIYAEKVQQKTVIKTAKGIYEVYDSISSMERKLSSIFIRVNQSVIVNKYKILELKRNTVYMSSGEEFTIGRTFVKKIKEECKLL